MKLPRLVILLALALAGAAVSSASASAAPGFFGHHRAPEPPHQQESFVVGHAYVNDNTATANTVAGFDRHADGSLTPIPGSPFPTGGAGSGAGLASQGAIQLSSDGRYLLAVDAASNQVSVLRLGFGGVPQPVGAPVSSGGSDPVSIAISGNLVYVANAGPSEPNVTGFYLAPWGVLYPLPSSTVALGAGSGPDDVLFDPTGQKLDRPARQHLDDRELPRRSGWPPARRSGLALRGPGTGTVRLGVPADQSIAAVRQQRPRRRRQRDGLGLQRELLR